MNPDKYTIRNPSHPSTALAAWMGMAKLTRKAVAKAAGIAENTMSSAMRGSVRLTTATLIAEVVRLDAQIIADGQVRSEWSLNLRTDGVIEVLT
jgi:plasmid maintenance system antidote protein VapI